MPQISSLAARTRRIIPAAGNRLARFSTSSRSYDYADTLPNLKIGAHTRVLFQGFTGTNAPTVEPIQYLTINRPTGILTATPANHANKLRLRPT